MECTMHNDLYPESLYKQSNCALKTSQPNMSSFAIVDKRIARNIRCTYFGCAYIWIFLQRNYRYFFFFVSSSTLLCIYVFSMCALYIKFLMDEDYPTVWKAMKHSPASVVLMIYCFASLWFVGGLTGFHLYLISTNQTTYENFRYRTNNRSAYNRGCASNFLEVFCTRIQPSRHNFRAFVQEEPPVLSPRRCSREPEPESASEPRSKVEDDLEIGGELMKISQRRNLTEVRVDKEFYQACHGSS